MSAQQTPGPFEVSQGCESYVVTDGNGQLFVEFDADFNSATREWSNHTQARAKAEQCCAALNVAYYLAKATGSAT